MEQITRTSTTPPPTPALDIINASEISPTEVSWLWYPFIPYGKVTLLQSDPGNGKSTFVLTLAALLTNGRPLPFTDPEKVAEPMNVIYQTTEDDADDTIVPHFIKADGNRDRLLFINEKEKSLTFEDEHLREAVKKTGATARGCPAGSHGRRAGTDRRRGAAGGDGTAGFRCRSEADEGGKATCHGFPKGDSQEEGRYHACQA